MSNTLPEGYIKLNWIGSTGTQAIDTGVIPNPVTSYDVEVVAIKDKNTSLFGAGRSNYVCTGYYDYKPTYSNYFYVGQASADQRSCAQILGTLDQTAFHTWKIKSGIGYCDNLQAANPERVGSTQPAVSLYLFARNDNNAVNDAGPHIMSSAKIWYNGTLVRNMEPCLRASDMKPGMYDYVNDVFYTNIGTGEFIYNLEQVKTIIPLDSFGGTEINNFKSYIDNQAVNYKTLIYHKG